MAKLAEEQVPGQLKIQVNLWEGTGIISNWFCDKSKPLRTFFLGYRRVRREEKQWWTPERWVKQWPAPCHTSGITAHLGWLTSACIQHSVSALQVTQDCRKQAPTLETQYTTVQHQKLLLSVMQEKATHTGTQPCSQGQEGRTGPQPRGRVRAVNPSLSVSALSSHTICLKDLTSNSLCPVRLTWPGENDAISTWEHLIMKQFVQMRSFLSSADTQKPQTHSLKEELPITTCSGSLKHEGWHHPCLVFTTFFNINSLQTYVVTTRAVSLILAVNKEQQLITIITTII